MHLETHDVFAFCLIPIPSYYPENPFYHSWYDSCNYSLQVVNIIASHLRCNQLSILPGRFTLKKHQIWKRRISVNFIHPNPCTPTQCRRWLPHRTPWCVCEFIRTMSVSTVSALQNISSLIVIVFGNIYHTPTFCRSTSIIIHHPNSGFWILFRVC